MRKKPFATFVVDPLPAFRTFSNCQKEANDPIAGLQPLRSSTKNQEYACIKGSPIKNGAQDILNESQYQNKAYVSRPGDEISRLTHTIGQIASRPKVIFASSKQNSKGPRVATSSSSFTTSTSSLPRLDRTVDQSAEESKLMEQIRRVQNRIKELKFQRSQATLAQKNFDMIRPFLEIQSQNMVNLQMMILAQNNKPCYGGHCHSLDRFAHHPYSSVPYSVRETNQGESESDEDPYQKKYKVNAKKKQGIGKANANQKNQKKYNLMKLRKFRVAVIAVYFSLLFPKYSNKFTLKRYRIHAKEFYTQVDNSKEATSSFIEEMLKLNSVKISQYVRSVRMQKTQRRVAKTAKLIITQQYQGKKNFQFFIGDVQLFLLQYLRKLEAMIEEGGLESAIRYIGRGSGASSFPIDNYYLLQQIYRFTFDPIKIYLKLTPQESKALIISALMVKLLVFDYFFVIKDSFQLKKKLQKQNKLKNQQMIEVELATTEMYFSGIVLHQYSMDLIRETFEASDGNANAINPTSLPIPRKSLIFNHFGDVEKALGANVQNKPLKRNSISSGTSQHEEQVQFQLLDIEQHEDELLYQFAYIKNLQHFQQLMGLIKKSSDFQTQIKDKIMDIVDLVYEKIAATRREEYKKIKQEMLLDQKHILKHKISVQELKLPKRTAEERQFLKKIVQIIQENKQLEQEQDNSEQKQEEEQQSVASLPKKQAGKDNRKRARQSYSYSSTSSN